MTLDVIQLDRLVRQIPHEQLSSRRWFRSKARQIADMKLEDSAALVAEPGGCDAALLIVRVSFADGGTDELYLLPMLSEPDASGTPSAEAEGIVAVRDPQTGAVLREPRDGDGVWRRLAAGLAAEMTLTGLHGSFVFHALQPVPQVRLERRLSGEQSNTSVALGDRLLLKLYRRLEPGQNPDLELPRFLTRAGFDRVPAVSGYIRYIPARGKAIVAAMLQAFLPDAVDAWQWLLNELVVEADPDAALGAVGRIGTITARMHAALASQADDPAFPARPASLHDRRAWRASANAQLERALAAAPQLAPRAPAIRAAFDGIVAATGATLSRIHGDYHLGQLLRSDDDFWVVDFEGEPARTLMERREPQSPLKDVAGMLRSLDYAVRTVARGAPASGSDPAGSLSAARQAFLQAYVSGGMPIDERLLRAFELEKACYEVHYEANNRPDWVWLPLQALDRLTREG